MLTESLSVYRAVIYAHLVSTGLEPGVCYSAVLSEVCSVLKEHDSERVL